MGRGEVLKIVILNANKITDKALMYEAFRANLDYPADYGENLDALHDFLTEPNKKTKVIFKNLNQNESPLNAAYEVFSDASADSSWLKIQVEE